MTCPPSMTQPVNPRRTAFLKDIVEDEFYGSLGFSGIADAAVALPANPSGSTPSPRNGGDDIDLDGVAR